MAKIIKKITFIIFVFIIILSAKVYANELTIECQESINPKTENTLECIVKGDFTDNVNSIKVRYTLPEGVEFEGFIPKESWNLEQGGTKDTTGFILRINEGDVTGQVEFGKFVFKVPSTYNKDDINIKLYELDATNTSCEIVDFDNIDVIKNIKIVKEDDDTSNKDENGNGNDETDKPSDDKNETDDGKDETDGNIEVPKDDNNSDGDLGTNNNSNNNQSDSENDMSTNQGDKENINSDNINNNNNIDKTPSKTPFGQYGKSNIIIILIAVVATIGFIVYKKLKKIKFAKTNIKWYN